MNISCRKERRAEMKLTITLLQVSMLQVLLIQHICEDTKKEQTLQWNSAQHLKFALHAEKALELVAWSKNDEL